MTDTIILTIKEVRKARGEQAGCDFFLHYRKPCEEEIPNFENDCLCHLCKKLTKFAKEGENE